MIRSATEVTESGCWLWTRARRSDGYGRLWFRGRNHYTHRISYAAHKGPIPPGLVLDHLCKATPCCNPEHLEVVTLGENVRRASRTPRGPAKRTKPRSRSAAALQIQPESWQLDARGVAELVTGLAFLLYGLLAFGVLGLAPRRAEARDGEATADAR